MMDSTYKNNIFGDNISPTINNKTQPIVLTKPKRKLSWFLLLSLLPCISISAAQITAAAPTATSTKTYDNSTYGNSTYWNAILPAQTDLPDQNLPAQTDLNTSNNLSANLSANWMQDIAKHVLNGQNNTSHLAVSLSYDAADTLYDAVKTLYKILPDTQNETHAIMNIGSLPITSRQQSALKKFIQDSLDDKNQKTNNSKNSFEAFLDTMYNWTTDDIVELRSLYDIHMKQASEKLENDMQDNMKSLTAHQKAMQAGLVPWIYWISEVFDLRIVNLPSGEQVDTANIILHQILKTSFSKIYTPNNMPVIKNALDILAKYTQEYLSGQYTQAEATLKFALSKLSQLENTFTQDEKHLTKLFQAVKNGIRTEDAKANKFMSDVNQVASSSLKTDTLIDQLLAAQQILKTWNARTFELLGTSDNIGYMHPVYGKFQSQNNNELPESFKAWDASCLSKPFPIDLFTLNPKQNGIVKNFDLFGLDDVTELISDFFSSTKNAMLENTLPLPDASFVFQLQMKDVNNQIQTLDLDGTMSNILLKITDYVKINANSFPNIDRTAVVYQCFYRMLLSAALTDNKFASGILNCCHPLYTSLSILSSDGSEAQHNPVGIMLAYVRQILLNLIVHEPEFIDFLTTYRAVYKNGIDVGAGHCKVDLTLRTDTDPTFQYVYNRKVNSNDALFNPDAIAPITATDIAWIKPFHFNQTLGLLSNALFTIDFSSTMNPIDNLNVEKKALTDRNNTIDVYSIENTTKTAYFPAFTKELYQTALKTLSANKDTFTAQTVFEPKSLIDAEKDIKKKEMYTTKLKQLEKILNASQSSSANKIS